MSPEDQKKLLEFCSAPFGGDRTRQGFVEKKELTMDQKVSRRKGAVPSRVEAIVERLRALDAEEQKSVLDFVEGIEREKSQTLWDAI